LVETAQDYEICVLGVRGLFKEFVGRREINDFWVAEQIYYEKLGFNL